jgi:hypothetical protein
MKTKWNSVSVFCGQVKGGFFMCFAGYQKFWKHRVDKFLLSLKPSSLDFASSTFTICASHSENLFVQPSWFAGLNSSDKSILTELVFSGVLEGTRKPEILKKRIDFPKAHCSEILSSF